jgi:hypothetical protein
MLAMIEPVKEYLPCVNDLAMWCFKRMALTLQLG